MRVSLTSEVTQQNAFDLPFGMSISIPPNPNKHPVSRRRLLGRYYTPDAIAEILVRWALDGKPGSLLDPSFGGCSFLEAGARVMEELGTKCGGKKVFGVDVDPDCLRFIRSSSLLYEENCTFKDFLKLSPDDLSDAPFQTVVGNPPYVRHHWVKDAARDAARSVVDRHSVELSKTASLWAYFVLHAVSFLAKGGNLAFLVPEAILQADYAVAIRDYLQTSFRSVRLVHIRERLFKGTSESVVLIAGKGYGESGSLTVHSLDTVTELEALLRGVVDITPQITLANGRRILPEALEAVDLVQGSTQTVRFGSFAKARIGIVTGANDFFIRAGHEFNSRCIPSSAGIGIVSRTSWLSGLDFTSQDHKSIALSDSKAFLVRPTPEHENEPGVRRWVREGEEIGIHKRYKCSIRKPWYRVALPARPDAFVTSTRFDQPLLVLNRTSLRCTNALYPVEFTLDDSIPLECISMGFLTTFVALWAELNSRRYGGGALKAGLGTLAQFPIPIIPKSASAFSEANNALREGDKKKARAIADRAVLIEGLGISREVILTMIRAHQYLVQQRTPETREL